MRLGVLDIGSNTVHLLLVDAHHGAAPIPASKLKIPLRLAEHLTPGGSGVRAQAMSRDGTLLQDFHLVQKPRALHVINAPSPAATASLAIADEIAGRIA